MSTSTRVTLTTRVSALEADVAALRAEQAAQTGLLTAIAAKLDAGAPAKATPARKAPAKPKARKAAPKPPAKGAQTRETLSRKDWNRTLTTLAKTQPKGSGAYKAVLDAWDVASEARDAGMTPREALALILG